MAESYRVLPREPLLAQASDVSVKRPSVSFWGPTIILLVLSFALNTALIGSGTVPESSASTVSWSIWLGALGVSCLIYWLRKEGAEAVYQDEVGGKIKDLQMIRLKQSETEALQVTQVALSHRSSIESAVATLPHHIRTADKLLREAEEEYNDRAFAPFWDRIERAAASLAEFSQSVDSIRAQTTNYHRALHGRIHNFPALRIDSVLPSPDATIREFNRLARLGQRNFEFASIWEQRRTRAILIKGFTTLGQAVNNLGETIDFTIEGLRKELSSGTDELLKEQRRMRESFDAAAKRWEDLNRARTIR